MKNKKGFTLIELLAVIVILAIIALIATPIVLNMINQARKSAAKTSSLSFIDSIEYYAGFSEISNTGIAMERYPEQLPKATKTTGTTTTNVNVTCEFNGSTWTTTVESGATLVNSEETCAKFFGTNTDAGVIARTKGKIPDAAKVILNYKGKVQNGSTFDYNGYRCTYENLDAQNCAKN